MALAPGEMLTDDLELVRELGAGGMGAVWVARNLKLDSSVAVKILRRVDGDVAEHRRRFELEARGLAQLSHPHLVKIFDFGMTMDGDPFIVMELLEGEDLAQHLAKKGPLSPEAFAPILTQTCKALTEAHAAGVIHRDIKPANLFLLSNDDGEVFVKLVDFGVAKFAASGLEATKTGIVLGTPYYMSPEQFMAPKTIDGRTDLWSLAVVAYAALTGKLPFQGETLTAVGMAVATGKYEAPTTARAGLPSSLDAWFRKALATEMNGRWGTPKELAESFLAAVGGEAPAKTSMELADTARIARAPSRTPEPEPSALAPTKHEERSRAPVFAAIAIAAAGAGALGVWAMTKSDGSPPIAAASSPGTSTSAADSPSSSSASWPATSGRSVPSVSAPDVETVAAIVSASPAVSVRASVPAPKTTSPSGGLGLAGVGAGGGGRSESATTEPELPAAKSTRSTSAAATAVQTCWKGTAQAIPGTAASSVQVSLPVTESGNPGSPTITGPGRSHSGFVSCSVSAVTSRNYGPGPAETLVFSVSLPAADASP